jgi:hypothetical protein
MIDIPSPCTSCTNNVSTAEEQFCFGIVQKSNMLQAQEITSTTISHDTPGHTHAASGHACQAHAIGGRLQPCFVERR